MVKIDRPVWQAGFSEDVPEAVTVEVVPLHAGDGAIIRNNVELFGIGIVGLVAFGDGILGIDNEVEDVGSDAEAAKAVVLDPSVNTWRHRSDGPGRLQNAVHVQLRIERGRCCGVSEVGEGPVDVERVGCI